MVTRNTSKKAWKTSVFQGIFMILCVGKVGKEELASTAVAGCLRTCHAAASLKIVMTVAMGQSTQDFRTGGSVHPMDAIIH